MKKFLLLVVIFLFGLISGAINSTGYPAVVGGFDFNTPAQINSSCNISDNTAGVLSNYRYSIIPQDNTGTNQSMMLCLSNTGKYFINQNFIIKNSDFSGKTSNNINILEINPRAP